MTEVIKELFGTLLHVNDQGVFDIRNRKEIPVHRVKEVGDFILFKNKDKIEKIDYGLFKLHVYDRFFLPIEFWKLIKVGFLNNDTKDYSLNNIYLIYPKGGVEHPSKKGFYFIPGYELNLINKNGSVYRILKSELRIPKKDINKNIYPQTVVDINKKRYTGRTIHRLLALTFKNPPKGYPNLVVDHLNGKKHDFNLDNLEWVTYRVNNTRAVKNGLREDGKVILVKDKETNEVNEYFSLTEFARSLEAHPQYIVDARTNPNQTYKKRWIIKDLDDSRDWSYFESKSVYSDSFSVKARCIKTGEVTEYKTPSEASVKTGTQKNALRQFFRNNSDPCILNGYEFKKTSDLTPWAEFNEYQLEIYRRGLHRKTRVYEVLDLKTKEVVIYYGWKPLSKLTGLEKRTIINIGKNNGVLNNRYKLKTIH